MAREAEFTEGLSVLITKDHHDRLEAMAERERVSKGEITRDVLELGLPERERQHAERMGKAAAAR